MDIDETVDEVGVGTVVVLVEVGVGIVEVVTTTDGEDDVFFWSSVAFGVASGVADPLEGFEEKRLSFDEFDEVFVEEGDLHLPFDGRFAEVEDDASDALEG